MLCCVTDGGEIRIQEMAEFIFAARSNMTTD